MTSESTIKVAIDTAIGAAYVQLSEKSVARTEEFSEDINVDLDKLGMVVGIELLDTGEVIPLDELTTRYHMRKSTLERLIASLHPAGPTTTTAVSSTGQHRTTTYRTIRPQTANEQVIASH